MRKSKIKESNNGITLIALVITIIVLLILAGVAIVTLTGDNGLLQKAGEAKNTTLEAEGLEKIQLAVMASHDNRGINTTSLAENLSKINGLTDTNNQAITEITLPKSVKLNNTKYDIKEDGTVEKSLLPLEYEQVEYLESSGKQYINTGYYPDQNTNAKYKVSVKEYQTYGPHLLSSKDYYFPFYRTKNNSLAGLRGGTPFGLTNVVFSANTIYEYEAFNENNIIINGEIVETVESTGTKDTIPLYIGTYGAAPGNASYSLKGKIYYCKIFNNEILTRDLIPCYCTTTVTDVNVKQCSAGTAGLYDTVEGKFYTNQGTGTFGYGMEDGT